jgi:hypothetical protein
VPGLALEPELAPGRAPPCGQGSFPGEVDLCACGALWVDVEGVLDWPPEATSLRAPGSLAAAAPGGAVPVVVLAVAGEDAVAMPTALPAARAPATIAAPSSLDMVIAINLLGVERLLSGILRAVAKRTCRGA